MAFSSFQHLDLPIPTCPSPVTVTDSPAIIKWLHRTLGRKEHLKDTTGEHIDTHGDSVATLKKLVPVGLPNHAC